MMQSLGLSHLLTLHGLTAFSGLVIYVLASHVRGQRRHPSAAIAWVVSLALLPYVALPLYFFLGNRKALRAPFAPLAVPLRFAPGVEADSLAARFQHLAAAMALPPADSYDALQVHQDGQEALAALRRVMGSAESSLDVSTFLLGRDVLGEEVQQLLMARAQAGARVRLLVDGVGVYMGGRPHFGRLSAAGVQIAFFVSPLRSALVGRTNMRNHRKMVIADGGRVWCGGRNLAAEYFVGDPAKDTRHPPWTDLSFDFQGQLADHAQQQFDMDWAFATQTSALPSRPKTSEEGLAAGSAAMAQFVPGGPDQKDDTVYSLLVSSCFNARRRILVTTPYFVPDTTLLMAMTLAARRGVCVDLLMPKKSNHLLADVARHAALRDLAMAGGRVWMFPRMIHAKAVVIDGELAMAGSANLDGRSLFLNYELMVAFFKPDDVQRFTRWIDGHISNAAPYAPVKPGFWGELGEGLVRGLAFQL
ncbi:MAG: phospholipase D-like domain-containing protein [Pseudomonadota bacterium]